MFSLIQLVCIIILMSQVGWPVLIMFIIIIAISIWYQASQPKLILHMYISLISNEEVSKITILLQNYYISAARELARMAGIRKAPILHHFSESIAGAPTIRCFGQEERFFLKNLSLIDDYSRITFHNSATMEWLCVRINTLFNLVFFLVLIMLVTMPRNAIDPSKLFFELETRIVVKFKMSGITD